MALALPAKAQSHSDSSDADVRALQYEPTHDRDEVRPPAMRCDSGEVVVDVDVDAGREVVIATLVETIAGRVGEEDVLGHC